VDTARRCCALFRLAYARCSDVSADGRQWHCRFLLYWSGGTNDFGRPAYLFGFEFLRVFGIAVGIGVVLIVIGALVRLAVRFDTQLLNALSRHADLDRHR
jgi:hypothetical protein